MRRPRGALMGNKTHLSDMPPQTPGVTSAPFRRRAVAVTLAAAALAPAAGAQPSGGHAGMPMSGMRADTAPDLRMFGPLGLSTFRQGSGTTWVPDAVTLPFYHIPT